MDGPRDSREKAVVLGILVPIAVVVLALWNLGTGQVYFPPKRMGLHLGEMHSSGLFIVYRDAWIVWGTIVLKLGCAGALVSVFGLGNWERFEDRADAALRWSTGVMAGGLVIVAYGFLR